MTRVRETIAHRIEAERDKPPLTADELLAEGCARPQEAVRLSGLSTSALKALMDKDVLPYVRHGRARRIPRVALLNFLRTRLVRRDEPASVA